VCQVIAGTVVRFFHERTNRFDPLAIRVETKEGIKLGYVPAGSIQQSELHNAHRRGFKCIGVITAFNKTNPTWCMITVQAKRTETDKQNKVFDVPFDK